MRTELALKHLALRMQLLNRALRAAVAKQGQLAARLARPDITHLCITDDQVEVLLGDADALLAQPTPVPGATTPDNTLLTADEATMPRARASADNEASAL